MKKIYILLLLITYSNVGFSQNNLGSSNDEARISLLAVFPQQVSKISEEAKAVLINKMNLITSKYGIGGSTAKQRFIITANVIELTKDITPTTPAIYTYNLQLTLYIGDGIAGTLFSSLPISLKGSGKSEAKAYIMALKGLDTNDPKYGAFIEEGKTKIIKYYNSKCDFLLKEAEMLTSKNEFDAAIATLTAIPEVCKDCYDRAMSAVAPIYKQQIDRQCKASLMEAKNAWNQSQDASGASAASNYLGQIDPNASCYSEAIALSNSIAKRIKELDQREWNFQMKQQQDDVDIQKATIKAARDIGVAYGNGPKANVVQYNVYGWW
ncbi:hypothetical protein [Flavobacterium sp.]|jgi:hypothetical protein|uniref:hypothetical protein n=1 Tax=Flavobacterium sp. TaxID=239 RepID=UPI0037C09901